MQNNRALPRNDFLPTNPQVPPNTGSTELFPDDGILINATKIWTTHS
jgi:hypothetical protein